MRGYDKVLMKLLHYSGAANLLSPWLRGRGTIFMLHHVLPQVATWTALHPMPALK